MINQSKLECSSLDSLKVSPLFAIVSIAYLSQAPLFGKLSMDKRSSLFRLASDEVNKVNDTDTWTTPEGWQGPHRPGG